MPWKYNPFTDRFDYFEASGTPAPHGTTHVTGGSDVIANAISGGNAGLMSGTDKAKLDGIATGAEVNVNADWNAGSGDAQILNKPSTMPPSTHATSHVTGGSDVIASVIAGGNAGLMTGSDKTKLDGIASGAEVNVNADWNSGSGDSQILNKPTAMAPTAHAGTHVTGGGDVVADVIAGGASGLMSGTDKTKLNGIAAGAEVNVNADWNAGSGDAQILNKPSSMTPTAHAGTHVTGGGDTIASVIAGGNAGLMTGSDKTKLDGISSGATVYTDEMAQDAVGAMCTGATSLVYTDATPLLALAADAASPGNDKVYGTSAAGAKGWRDFPASAIHDLGGASHNADTLANLNLKISDADVPALAGQIGGTAASPAITGLRETGGPTLIAMGVVADGEYLKRSGTTIVGAVPAGGALGVVLDPSSDTTINANYHYLIPEYFYVRNTYTLTISDTAAMVIV